jgi:hypothetical protein
MRLWPALGFVLASATFGAGAGAATAPFWAQNGLRVVAVSPDAFFVPFGGKSDVQAFWCAAGDYVIDALGLPGVTQIYRVSEPPRRSGAGISFSLDPAQAASTTGMFLLGHTGAGVHARFAESLCSAL